MSKSDMYFVKDFVNSGQLRIVNDKGETLSLSGAAVSADDQFGLIAVYHRIQFAKWNEGVSSFHDLPVGGSPEDLLVELAAHLGYTVHRGPVVKPECVHVVGIQEHGACCLTTGDCGYYSFDEAMVKVKEYRAQGMTYIKPFEIRMKDAKKEGG